MFSYIIIKFRNFQPLTNFEYAQLKQLPSEIIIYDFDEYENTTWKKDPSLKQIEIVETTDTTKEKYELQSAENRFGSMKISIEINLHNVTVSLIDGNSEE